MADRIVVSAGAVAGAPSPVGPRVARFIAAGQTQFGPVSGPLVVRSLTEYRRAFGARSGGANLYDAAEFFFANQGGEMVVQRAFGPSAVNSTVTLDSKITVTAKAPGAYYDAWTAQYVTGDVGALVLSKGTRSVTYTGATAAALQSAASVDPDVTVTVTALPSGNVAATNLASGTDDFANVNWATVLGRVTSLYGPGVMAVPGVNGAAAALAAAANPRRWALLTPNVTDTDAQVITAQGAITAANRQYASYVNQWGWVADGAGGVKQLDGTVYAATVRGVCLRVLGVGESPLRRQAHQLVSGFTPMREIDDATHTSLDAAGVVTIRTLASGVGIDVWATAEGAGANPNLTNARFRDLINAITDDCYTLLDSLFTGGTASVEVLSQCESALKGVLEGYTPWLTGGAGEGYRVSVSPGALPNDNRISAVVSVRFTEGIDWIDLSINYADAGQSI